MSADPVQPATLELRGLCVTYGRVRALSDVELRVVSGEVLALLGPSGSGKSTLLHTVAGFQSPQSGEVWLNGRCVSSASRSEPPERRELAMVFQNYALWPHLSALDTVAYPARRRGESRARARAQARSLLERLNVGHLADRHPAELSGGEQQRVAVARAWVNRPKILLADEPTGNLDSKTGNEIMGVFDRLHQSGNTIVLVTHEPDIAAYAHRVIHIRDGQVEKDVRRAA